MQQEVDQIMRTVSSRATAEAARQELQTRLEREREEQQQELAAALQERDAARSERDAARQGRFALRQRVAELEEEQAGLRSKFSITRQDDLLRHVLSTTVDFSSFTVRKVAAIGGNGTVLECGVTVPAWCVADEGTAKSSAFAAGHQAARKTAEVVVAVKVLAGVADPRHTTLKHRFLREFQTLSDMPPHPNIVTLLAHLTKRLPRPMFDLLPEGFRLMVGDATSPVLALIMPLLPRTLEAAAAAGAEPAQLVRWCLDVAAAVAHMWAHRWVHLDLKLNNVLVAADGRAVLTDMGTAMPVAADGSLTVPAHVGLEGNLSHRAPEVLATWDPANRERDPAALARIDAGRQEVWALGVLLHELVAGKHPYGEQYPLAGWEGDAAVDEATLLAHGLSATTVAVVRRMVSKDAGERPANPVDAHADLVASLPPAHGPVPDLDVLPPRHDAHAPKHERRAVKPAVSHAPSAGKRVPAVLWLLIGLLLGAGAMLAAPPLFSAGLVRGRNDIPAAARRTGGARDGASRGDEGAAACLGPMQEHSEVEALQRRAAEQDEADAQNDLAYRYEKGLGVAPDPQQAVAWYRRAAEQGHADAQNNLGYAYARGQGVHQQPEEAAAWYRRAAEQGHAGAQFNLGWCFANGQGVEQDLKLAAVWYERAAGKGHASAHAELQLIRQRKQ